MKKAVCGILAYEKSSMQYSGFYTWKSRLLNKIEEENMNTQKGPESHSVFFTFLKIISCWVPNKIL